jgi:hypothetical protein
VWDVKVEEIPGDGLEPVKPEKPHAKPKAEGQGDADDIFAYLWQGKHAAYSEEERQRRIKSVQAVLPFAGQPLFRHWLAAHLPSTDSPTVFMLGAAIGMVGTLLGKRCWIRQGAYSPQGERIFNPPHRQ